ncbi:MAG: PQQ-binding-like beta-propeller repeat protein, partial [Alphaproteobacteria bacterium]
HAMQHLAISDLPTRIWQTDIGTGSDDDAPILSGPVVADGRVYAMDADAVVTAHDASNGRRLWRTELEKSEERDGSWGGGVALDGGRLYAATGFAQVVALDAMTGEVVWRTSVSGPVRAAPTVFNGRIFAISRDNQLHALDAEDGELLWTDTGIVESASLLGGVSPAVDGDIVVAPYSSGEVVALRAENGRQLWSDNLAAIRRVDAVSALADIGGRPVIDRGRVYAISHSGRMVAIDLRTGRRLWEADLGGVQQPWVAGEFIFVLTSSAHVVSLMARDGRVRWVTPLGLFKDPEDRKGRINWSGPVLVSDRLIVAGSHGEVLSLSPYTGEILGHQPMRDSISIAPAVADETLFFLTDSAKLIAMR